MMQQDKEQLSTNFSLLSENAFKEDSEISQGLFPDSSKEGFSRVQTLSSRTLVCPRTGL